MSNIQYDRLMISISSLFIVNSYRDSVNVGKDDSLSDSYNIFFYADFYLKSCIDKCLKEKLYLSSKEITYTEVCYSNDRGVARYPRKGIYIGGSSDLFKMWLYANTLKYYSEDKHLKFLKDPNPKIQYHDIWLETQITIGEIKKFDDYYTVKLLLDEDKLGHKKESFSVNVINGELTPENAKQYLRNILIEKYYVENRIVVKEDL